MEKLSANLKQLKCLDPGVNLYTQIPGRYPSMADDDDDDDDFIRHQNTSLLDSIVPLSFQASHHHNIVDDDAPDIFAPLPPPPSSISSQLSFDYEHITHGMQLNQTNDDDISSQIAVTDANRINENDEVLQVHNHHKQKQSRIVDRRPPLPPRICDSIRASTLSSLMQPTSSSSECGHYDVPRAISTISSSSPSPLYDYPLSPRFTDTTSSINNSPLPVISENVTLPLYENCSTIHDRCDRLVVHL